MKKADLDLYTDYLLSTFGAATATGLSAMVDGDVSHDQITRFLSAQEYTSKDLWHQVRMWSGITSPSLNRMQCCPMVF